MVKLKSFVAYRYLRSPKSHSVINMITWVAGAALTIPTAALILILSLHNGLNNSIQSLFSSFDSEIRITAKDGKFFAPERISLEGIPFIEAYSRTIEDNVLVKKGEREYLAVLRGVDSLYSKVIPINNLITRGKFELRMGDADQAIVGQGVAYNLGVNLALYDKLDIYAIMPDRGNSLLPTPIFRTKSILPAAIYESDNQTDNHVIVPLEFAQQVLSFSGKISSVEVLLKSGMSIETAKKELQEKLGDDFKIQTRFEQKESIYKAVNQEKWIIYLLLMMVFAIASLSLVGSVIIIIADKRKHIGIFRSMGATTGLIRGIFRREGMLIVIIGSVVGLILGVALALIQQYYGVVKMVGETMQLEAYPVIVQFTDILIIMCSVWSVGWLLSWITTHVAIKDNN